MREINTERLLMALKVADEINTISRGEGPSRNVFLVQDSHGIRFQYFHSYATASVDVSDAAGKDTTLALPLDVLLDILSPKGVGERVRVAIEEKRVTIYSKIGSRHRRNRVHVVEAIMPMVPSFEPPTTSVRAVDEVARMLEQAAKAMHGRKGVPRTSMVGPLIRLTVGGGETGGFAEIAATDQVRFYHRKFWHDDIDGKTVSVTLSARYAKSVARIVKLLEPDELLVGQFGITMRTGDDCVNVPVSTHKTPNISNIVDAVLSGDLSFLVDSKALLDAFIDIERNLGQHVILRPDDQELDGMPVILFSSKHDCESEFDVKLPVPALSDFSEITLGTSAVITGLQCFDATDLDVFVTDGKLQAIGFYDGQQSYFCAGLVR